MSEQRYDVRASVCDATGGLDGAYDLIADDCPVAEVLGRLEAVLKRDPAKWVNGPVKGHVFLSIHIGPAGSADDLPI